MASTLYEKLWQQHVVEEKAGETPLLYVDRHLIHEVTSPQAFANLKFHNRQLQLLIIRLHFQLFLYNNK